MQVRVIYNNGVIAEKIDGGDFHLSGHGVKECHSDDNRSVTLCQGVSGDDLVTAMKGIFFGKEDVARRFLNDIADVKPTQVIEMAGRYIANKEMSSLSCHRDLWRLLHDNGYYEPGESNWNKALSKL